MAESLLAHLYSRIKGSQEDVATISLQYILSLSPVLNEEFSRVIFNSIDQEIVPGIDYKCQSVGENLERPDISGVDEAGNEIILCEAKFYAGLTSNQPNAYLDRMIKNNGKAVVFICPEARKITLWSKLVELCEGRSVSKSDRFCVNVDGIRMSIVTWNETIEALKTVASVSAVSALPDIQQLDGFCKMMDRTAFIPFASEDMGPDNALKEERYYQVIDTVFNKLIANKEIDASAKGLKASPNRNGYTRYIVINGLNTSIMYNRTAWISNTSQETPFWFYVDDDGWNQSDALKKKLAGIKEYEKETIGNSVAIALHPLLNVPLDDIAEDMMSQILEYIEMLSENKD